MFARKRSDPPAQQKSPTSLSNTTIIVNNTTSTNGVTHNITMTRNNTNNNGMTTAAAEERNPTAIIENIEAANNTTTTTTGNSVPLPTTVLQTLYHEYSIKQRQSGLKWFVFATILFNDWALIVPQGQSIGSLVVTFLALLLNLGICICMHLSPLFDSSTAWSVRKKYIWFMGHAPHMMWLVSILHFVLYSYLQQNISIRDILGWVILLNFLIHVTLPVTLLFSGLFGLGTFLAYILTIRILSRPDPLFYEQIYANIVLIATAQIIGLLYYFMGEAKQKRTFLETKQSLEVKMIIEEQSAEQERLLLSVLPKHVAVRMRQDLGSTSSEPFKKIYMSRHENVSILYADIVGFTAISSTYSAQDLVKMLNELFARFDRLAEKYSQLRIKILGDCYYCISGAPNERPDHAVLCVHMGLSMVKAIKYVQQKTNSPVDMRVGIHTGAVLAGILGQRQWQFDVYSKDVELANKMESSGKAGRVHISDKTLSFLNGEFEVEPAYGERREEALRIAGLKTYFIARVLRPFPSPAGIRINETQNNDNDQPDEDDELLANINTTNSTTTTTTIEIAVQSEHNNSTAAKETEDEKRNKMHDFKERLRDELIARDNHKNLSKGTTLWLKFINDELEAAYSAHREPYSSVPLIAALLVQISDVIYSYFIMPTSPLHFINISAPIIPILMLVFVSVAESFPRILPKCFVTISKKFNDIHFVRELAAIIIALTLGISNLIDMYYFVIFLKTEHIVSEAEFNTTQHVGENASVIAIDMGNIMYPSYLSNYCVLILIAVAVIAQLTHVSKIVLMILVTALHCFFNIFILSDLYDFEDNLASKPEISTSIAASSILILVTFALSMFARHMDREDRIIFKWKTEVAEQKERATDMRERNEALVYNILPVHVATYFMKNTIRSHDDLYSQSYAEVGVLFASMPNFSDFYSEETVNNQGLECLRFLNEVISDFDALLELPKFRDIIKIKTIGSTYMAASGINTRELANQDEAVTKRWTHLAELVEFALELKKALQSINEQSFNHFVLKMGINHGPITAGVIGARKPHYDIWGNTVNVASRMESTGKAGAIQVTEETCNILKEFGYTFQQRGLVSVKGKGQLMTYYLLGKSDNQMPDTSSIPRTTTIQTNGIELAPLAEVTLQRHEEPIADPKTPLLSHKPEEHRVSTENDTLLG